MSSWRHRRDARSRTGRRIAYYTRRFPVLTETFIQREVAALRGSGLDVITIADTSDSVETLGAGARAMVDGTIYLRACEARDFARNLRRFVSSHPWRLWRAHRQVVQHDYSRFKSPEEDREIFRRVVCLAATLLDNGVDHVHAPWAYINAFVAAVAARLAGVPFSVQARAFEIHAAGDMHVLREKFAAAEFIVTNTLYNLSHLCSLMEEPSMEESVRRKITVIHNGIDLRDFVPPARTLRENDPVRILTVARLVAQKGLTYLLEACNLLREQGFAFECTVIGAPFETRYAAYHRRLEDLHRDLKLEDCVYFAGGKPFEDVLKAYEEADVFVLPCVVEEDGNRDIIPNSLLEAMAMELAVVSTPVGGVSEIIEDGESGLLVPPGQSKALADAMARLLRSPRLRANLGEQARRKVEEKFDIRKNAAAYSRLFQASGP